MEILIAEDSEHIANRYSSIIKDVIAAAGDKTKSIPNVFITDSYKSFKHRKLDENNYDLVLLDWKLVKSTAKDILKVLNSKFTVVITGYADDSNVRKACEKYKVDHLLDKYIGLHTIEDLIRKAVTSV